MPPSVSLRSPPTPPSGGGQENMDAPFRLAPLATHPLSGGGQEKDGCPLPSRSARHPPPKCGWARKTWRRGAINPKPCLPLLAGGRGTASLPQILPPPPARSGKGPRSQTLASPRLSGAGDRVPKPLPPPARGGEGDHEVVEGGALKRSMPAKRA